METASPTGSYVPCLPQQNIPSLHHRISNHRWISPASQSRLNVVKYTKVSKAFIPSLAYFNPTYFLDAFTVSIIFSTTLGSESVLISPN
jgi:hypothetical protein